MLIAHEQTKRALKMIAHLDGAPAQMVIKMASKRSSDGTPILLNKTITYVLIVLPLYLAVKT